MGAGASLGRSEEEVGRLLVQRQIITSDQLEEALRDRNTRSLGAVLVEKGFIPSEDVLQALRSESGVLAKCGKCGDQFKILSYNPSSTYTCQKCGGPLEKMEAGDAAAKPKDEVHVLSAALAGASPEEVTAAAQDPKNLFGKFVLVKELARGGAGIVHKAWDSYLSRYIVLKFLSPRDPLVGDTPSVGLGIQDFLREAKLAARMRHPNIVPIHEVGCLNGAYYISMDFIGGSTFYQTIHGQADTGTSTRFHKEPERMLKTVRDVALAVEHAHHQKPPIVHRDLKPQNILIDAAGRAFVTDFGLALQIMLDRENTEEGLVKGTPSYMAPEQAEAKFDEIDARTDVYGLGAILYEVLCGRPPFVGDDLREVVNQVRQDRPNSPTQVISFARTVLPEGPNRPQPVPKELEKICLKALEKKKEKRYQTAGEFAAELDKYLKGKELAALEAQAREAVRRQERRRRRLLIAFVIVIVAGSASAIALIPEPPLEPADALVVRGSRHLEAGEWPALEGVIAELARLKPDHPEIAKFTKAIEEHAAGLAGARSAWSARLGELGAKPLGKVLGDLRAMLREQPELRAEFRDELKWALTALQPAIVDEIRQVVGSGVGPRWLDPTVKDRAKDIKLRVGLLEGLAADKEITFMPDPDLVRRSIGLDQVVAYRGTWYLQVNVAPFAEVVVRKAGKEVARDLTPLGIRGLEVVSEGYQVELFWPSMKNPKARVTKEIRNLENGATVVLQGNMETSEIRVVRK